MKALVSICFTLEGLDDDDLVMLSQRAAEGIRNGLLRAEADLPEGITPQDVAQVLDFYGATIAIQQSLQVEEEQA